MARIAWVEDNDASGEIADVYRLADGSTPALALTIGAGPAVGGWSA